MLVRSLSLVSLVVSGMAVAAPVLRQPTGKWVVEFADAKCLATRNYGSDADPVYLVLKAPAMGGSLQIGVVRKGAKVDATQFDGELVFDEAATIRTTFLEFGDQKLRQRALIANLSSQDLRLVRQAKSISIRTHDEGISRLGTRLATNASRAEESFALTQMPALMSMLDTCAADLRRIWKVWDDEGGSQGLKEGPKADLRNLFSPDDYPAIALVKDQAGSVALSLLIDEQGKVADCTVVATSGIAALDAQSCAIIKERGKFRPAIGLDGKPAKSSYFQRISWSLMG